eukprot:CAMPEP_0171117882 /NCGR_PEP_ID=MMETSP0766_2-20121228/93524_1 /TAXON_ID=439317 /ORGANISM="Gambierdiscus australes, Strain CAWD 149" /LENGTH=249 /DNA_ID=CAMNT_0011580423 /DNA_START=59 /DNA_END=808 /DNA_ORIENTATION=+
MNLYVRWRVGRVLPTVQLVEFLADPHVRPVRMPLGVLPNPPSGVTRVVIVSDTHEMHRHVAVPPGDLFLHCGDILMSSSLTRESRGLHVLQDFNRWLEQIPCREKVVIGGNHDWALMHLLSQGEEVLPAAVVLHDKAVELPESRLKIYGNAYSEGTSHNNAWQTEAPQVSDACAGAELVMTHHCSPAILEAVLAKAKPVLWASGHKHQDYGTQQRGGTLFVNAATMDSRYNPLNPPMVVDLPRVRPAKK